MNKQIVYPQALEMAFIDCPFDWSTKPQEDGIAREVVIGIERDGDDQYFICAGGHSRDHSLAYPAVYATKLGDKWYMDGRAYLGDLIEGKMYEAHAELMEAMRSREADRCKQAEEDEDLAY